MLLIGSDYYSSRRMRPDTLGGYGSLRIFLMMKNNSPLAQYCTLWSRSFYRCHYDLLSAFFLLRFANMQFLNKHWKCKLILLSIYMRTITTKAKG